MIENDGDTKTIKQMSQGHGSRIKASRISFSNGTDSKQGQITNHNRSSSTWVGMPCRGWKTLHQATRMPFLSKPLFLIFTNHGMNSKAFKEVLDGTFQMDSWSISKTASASHPKTPGIPSILPRTLADYMRGWKKAWETTSSSMSHVHFGQYMLVNSIQTKQSWMLPW